LLSIGVGFLCGDQPGGGISPLPISICVSQDRKSQIRVREFESVLLQQRVHSCLTKADAVQRAPQDGSLVGAAVARAANDPDQRAMLNDLSAQSITRISKKRSLFCSFCRGEGLV